MGIFTAAAAAIVGWIGATGLAATILSSVIATGLAMVTSRLINGNPGGGGGGGSAQQAGSRVQLSPDTTNKIPVIYGTGFFNAIVTDAYLHEATNSHMTYCMVIGETVNQSARFQGAIAGTTLTATDLAEGDSGTIQMGMRLRNTAGATVGVVEEFLTGTYGGVGTYRVSSPVTTAAQLLDGDFVYTVNDIYFNDMRLVFENNQKTGRAIQGRKHVDVDRFDPATGLLTEEDHKDDNFKDHVEVYVYAGNSTGTSQIGTNTPRGAFELVGTQNPAAGAHRKWKQTGTAGAERMEGLIFAVVKIEYDAEKGFTGIPNMTFDIACSANNPATVLFDYMRSVRFGAGIPASQINAASLGDFANYCNELVSYQPLGSSAPPTTQRRYVINGLLDTNRNVKENMDVILMNSGAWLSYDLHRGQWFVVPKRSVTASDTYPNRSVPATLLQFSDDNIIGGININSTRLDDLYNIAEVQYFDSRNKDQRGFHQIRVNAADRNQNEPDNTMTLNLELCNSNVQAERLANLELKQSRDDLVISFTTTHFGLQISAGDVITVLSPLYGWQGEEYPAGKPFRVNQTKEIEGEGGSLLTEVIALEYNPDVYADEAISEFTTAPNIGIVPRSSSVNIPAPVMQLLPNATNSRGGVPNFRLAIQLPATGGPYDEIQLFHAEGDDFAGTGGDTQFLADAAGNRIYVTSHQGPNVIRSQTNSGATLATEISGRGIPAGTEIQSFGATNSPYFGNGLTGYYTLNQSVDPRTGIVQCSGTIIRSTYTATVSGTSMTVTGAAADTVSIQSLIHGGVPSVTITSATATGTTLTVFELTGTITPGVTTGTVIRGQGLMPQTRLIAQVSSTESGGALGGRGVYTMSRANSVSISATHQGVSIDPVQGLHPNLPPDTVVISGPAGGGSGVYTLNKSATVSTPFTVSSHHAYPLLSEYESTKNIKPAPGGSSLLFNALDLRETFISALPANGTDKKYFVKARLGIAGQYGAFSELGEVDLEPPVIYWEPDSFSALNIKQQLVRMDFGLLVIPRNGLWLMRTATQLDGGVLATSTGDFFSLDLGNLQAEAEITSTDVLEDFRFDPTNL